MSRLHAYEYVNRPFASVRAALASDAPGVFHRATTSAAKRASGLAASLKIEIAGVEVGKEVELRIVSVDDHAHAPADPRTPAARFVLSWKAREGASFFPTMEGELVIYPLSPTETQLDFEGTYTPPLGVVGAAADAVIGHRVARASVRRFLDDVVERLRVEV
jgi:hypothetical protein